MRFAIDLLWVKPGNTGGAESYIHNLLQGFNNIGITDEVYLINTKDNAAGFAYLTDNKHFKQIICNIISAPASKRILWQNLHFENLLYRNAIDKCFCPFYCKPLNKSCKVKYVTVIHDLQQLHYPEYFTRIRYNWIKFAWNRAVKTSEKIIAISDFDKNDIIEKLNAPKEKVTRIYNPINIKEDATPFDTLKDKYGIERFSYYFALSSMLKHKNLDTLIRIIGEINDLNYQIPRKLVISGIGGAAKKEIEDIITEKNLRDKCILTGFISNEERNSLYINSYAFLFPSVFEGFGMPVVEAMILGVPVITTKKTSIPEVSENKAYYVDDPYSVNEWIEKLNELKGSERVKYQFPQYDIHNVAQQYMEVLHNTWGE